MSGFAPVEDAAAAAVDPNLVAVNLFLKDYRAAWDSLVDSWLVVRIGDPQVRVAGCLGDCHRAEFTGLRKARSSVHKYPDIDQKKTLIPEKLSSECISPATLDTVSKMAIALNELLVSCAL